MSTAAKSRYRREIQLAMARPKDPHLRGRILSVAGREFAQRGFVATSVDRIARRAGVTKGGVYLHFRSKETLFLEVLAAHRAERRELEAPSDAGAAAAQLEAYLVALLRFHQRRPEARAMVRLLGTELQPGFAAELRSDARAELKARRTRLRQLLSDGQRDGSLWVDDPALAAFVVAGAVEGIFEQWRVAAREAEPYGGPESLAAAIVAPYLTAARGRPPVPLPPPGERDFQPPF